MKHLVILFLSLLTLFSAVAYDFSAVSPSGQTLYYTIKSPSSVKLVSGDVSPTGSLEIPSLVNGYSVSEIDRMCFSDCSGLTSVLVPGSVQSIGMRAFASCTSLRRATLSEGVQTLGMMVFFGCTSLDTIFLPSTLTSIAAGGFTNTALMNNAENWTDQFLYCGAYLVASQSAAEGAFSLLSGTLGVANNALDYCHLSSLVLPASLRFIGESAFVSCSLLDTIRLLGDLPPSVPSSAFQGTPASLTVVVPCGSMSNYLSASVWNTMSLVEDSCSQGPHVDLLSPSESPVSIRLSQGGLLHIGQARGEALTVANAYGQILVRDYLSADESTFPLSSPGVYLVRVGNMLRKIVYLR